jgi:hypothetical protein
MLPGATGEQLMREISRWTMIITDGIISPSRDHPSTAITHQLVKGTPTLPTSWSPAFLVSFLPGS